jgi:nucleoside-diphosphate-sugar epimerase
MNNIILGYGQLGKEFVKQTGWDYISREKDKFDFKDLDTYICKIYKYDTIINCIGYTDTYSGNREKHWKINYLGVIQLANYCRDYNKKLIHISTDYVYTGSPPNATEESIPVHARNWYTYTKLLADGYVQAVSNNYLLIRTSFKPFPCMYPEAITTQFGNFDFTHIITEYIIRLIKKDAKGIFNVGTQVKTIYELALKSNPEIIPTNKVLDPSMPRDITMSIRKMREFLDEN